MLVLAETLNANIEAKMFSLLDESLRTNYKIDLYYLFKSFTLVADWVAVMPNIVGASTSSNIARLEEKWMRCIAHRFNTTMKPCLKLLEADTYVWKILEDLANVKTIVRILKIQDGTSIFVTGNT